MQIRYEKKFSKQYNKAPHKIQLAFDTRFKLFLENPFHPQLSNHALTGKFKGYRSINITGDWRAIFSELRIKNKTIIVFELLGTHSQLYK